MTSLLENLGCHVAWSTTRCGQDVELLFVHDSRQAEVCNEEIGIVFWSSEEEVFGLEISVYYTVIMEVGDCGEGCTDEVCGVRFVVGALSAYAIEEFSSERKICNEVNWNALDILLPVKIERDLTIVHGLKVVNKGQNIPVPHGNSLQDGDLVSDHMFSSCHKALVNHLRSIVASSVDVNAFFDDRV